MEIIRFWFIKHFKMILCICILLHVLLCIYCWPLNMSDFIDTLRASLMYLGFSLFLYVGVMLNCFTGAYEVFKKIPLIEYHTFIMLGSVFLLLSIGGLIGTLITHKIDSFSLTIAALIGTYIGSKTVDYIKNKMDQ